MTWLVTNFIAAFLIPPLNLLIMLLLGIALLKRCAKLAKTLLIVAVGLFWICSTPYFVDGTMAWLETSTHALPKPIPSAQAIVILGCGTYINAPEYEGLDTVKDDELARLRYGAKLQRETQLPILVSGGKPLGNDTAEAEQMRQVLEQEFHVPVRWIEDNSNTTFENARNSQRILQSAGIKRVLLVTHAIDMPRAAMIFRKFGVEVVEAPTLFTTHFNTTVLSFLPDAGALAKTKRLCHELIGILWYKIKTTPPLNTL
jgi:uncharacterized SAM-binding protein YcdF (DUF218 family)